jgi:hypothetical protein
MKFFCILCLHHFPQEEFADLDEFICRTCFPQREALLSPPSENQRSTLTPDRLLLPPGKSEGYPLLLPPREKRSLTQKRAPCGTNQHGALFIKRWFVPLRFSVQKGDPPPMSTRSRNTSLLRSAKAERHGILASPLLALPIIECGSLCVLLQILPAPTSVLLMPISRREGVMGSIKTTTAVHVTACTQKGGHQTILTATCVAAACLTVGGAGSLLWPCEERAQPAEFLWQRVTALQDELLHCLTRALEAHLAVACVESPARYRIPDEWLWSHPASLEGSGIRFDETTGHWTWTRQGSVPQAEQETNPDEPSRR